MEKAGLYIHIPFCERKCHYCDFTSVAGNRDLIDRYVRYLINEIKMVSAAYGKIQIETIFIGGGTPSVLSESSLETIMEAVGNGFSLDRNAEISIEINPGTLTHQKALGYRKAGINRASVGIQSMNNSLLGTIGRIHNEDQVIATVKNLRRAGFDNINGDLMFGLPHQSIDDFRVTLEKTALLDLEHISMYGLILEKNTPLYGWHERGLVSVPTEDQEREMYHLGIDFLKKKGYLQYEISNFAKKGHECRHNMGYWLLKPYIGVGISSHSSMEGRRYWNTSGFGEYFQKLDEDTLPIEGEETITKDMMETEYLILGIRLKDGISVDDYEKRFKASFMGKYGEAMAKHMDSGLLVLTDGNIRLTEKGMDLSNQVEMDFLP